MPEVFDPYHKWLGISPKDQPPNHYRLLAIEQFEGDPDVIEAAADQRMAHVRTYQIGRNSALSQTLLNELSAAKLCLLDAKKRAAYDQTLREKLRGQQAEAAPPPIDFDAALSSLQRAPPPSKPLATIAKRPRSAAWRLPAIVGAGLAALAAPVVWFAATSGREEPSPAMPGPSIGVDAASKPSDTKPKERPKTARVAPPTEVASVDEEKSVVNSLGMKLRYVPAGEFEMGLTPAQVQRLEQVERIANSEWNRNVIAASTPMHRVKITRPFYMGVYEVTVGQFRQFVDAQGYQTTAELSGVGGYGRDSQGQLARKPEYNWRHHGFDSGEDLPVMNVSWQDAVAFCRWLSDMEGAEYRLPTEAEWEYAAAGGTDALWPCGDDAAALDEYAWFAGNAAGDRHRAGQKQPNAFGLFDASGNVWEFCSDRYSAAYYASSPAADPQGPDEGELRVRRGGGYGDIPFMASSRARINIPPDFCDRLLGFRVVRAVPQ